MLPTPTLCSFARGMRARVVSLGLSALTLACVGGEAVGPSAGGKEDRARTGGPAARPPTLARAEPPRARAGRLAQGARGGAIGAGGSGGVIGGTGGTPGTGGRGGSAGAGAGGSGSSAAGLPYSENFDDGVANGFQSGIDDEQAPLGSWAVTMGAYREQTVDRRSELGGRRVVPLDGPAPRDQAADSYRAPRMR